MNILLVMLIVLVIVGGAAWLAVIVNNRQKKRDRFLSVITGNSSATESADRATTQKRADIAKKLKQVGSEREQKKKSRSTLRALMAQAGVEAPLSRYWVWSGISAVVVFLLLSIITGWPAIAKTMLSVAAFFSLPKMVLRKMAARRQKKFLSEFPDALDAAVRLLQAGMPISEAVAMISREFDGPIRDEMMRIYDNQKLGMSLGAAALEMAERIPLTEVHMFATALQIQSETGSSLGEVLTNLSAVIRARFRLKRKVQALSAEAKASAMIIGALPLLVSGGLYLVNPKYISILFDTFKGNIALGFALFWMFCGIIVMRQMINFKI